MTEVNLTIGDAYPVSRDDRKIAVIVEGLPALMVACRPDLAHALAAGMRHRHVPVDRVVLGVEDVSGGTTVAAFFDVTQPTDDDVTKVHEVVTELVRVLAVRDSGLI